MTKRNMFGLFKKEHKNHEPADVAEEQEQPVPATTENTETMNSEQAHAVSTPAARHDTAQQPELVYLEQLIAYRLDKYFPSGHPQHAPVAPPVDNWSLPLSRFIRENKLSMDEATLLLIGIAPHVHADLFDKVIESKLQSSGDFPKIGGVRGKNSRGFLPTGETALFLLAGDDWEKRLQAQSLFGADHLFGRKKILWLEELPQGEPVLSGRIIMSQDYVETFLNGKPSAPHFSQSFPARKIDETRDWNALVINKELQKQIGEILSWVTYNEHLVTEWKMNDRLKKGYRVLFYGPPGTGKTLTAGILGNELHKDVYKIDLSMVVSKYIGETEKNLELLFARAEDKGWILFFDEADALFSKRTNIRDAHDKYANQEVSYLLQRMEDYNGLIILATNMKNNIDDAFIRRFNSILKFPFPDAEERVQIWKKSFPGGTVFSHADAPVAPDTKENENKLFDQVKKYELTGGSIMNVVHYACLKAAERHKKAAEKDKTAVAHPSLAVYPDDVLDGIKREFFKDGKPFG